MSRAITFNLNSLFTKIPFNDASFTRIFKADWFTAYMKLVYTNGFALSVLIPFYRAALSIDFKKMLRYTCQHIYFKYFLLPPFMLSFIYKMFGLFMGMLIHLHVICPMLRQHKAL